MRICLVATLLTGLIGVTGANAQAKFVNLKMTNGFDKPVTIYVIDHNNDRKIDENKREISPGGDSTSQAKLDAKDYMEVVFSVKAPGDGRNSGYYCKRVSTSMKDKKEYKETLSKTSMKEGSSC